MQYRQTELTKERLNRALSLNKQRSILIPSREDKILNLLKQINVIEKS